jgi:hypothetical protein
VHAHPLSTIRSKVVVYAPAERADTFPLFLLYPYMYSVGRIIHRTLGPFLWEFMQMITIDIQDQSKDQLRVIQCWAMITAEAKRQIAGGLRTASYHPRLDVEYSNVYKVKGSGMINHVGKGIMMVRGEMNAKTGGFEWH